jgi:hypothetical protein
MHPVPTRNVVELREWARSSHFGSIRHSRQRGYTGLRELL